MKTLKVKGFALAILAAVLWGVSGSMGQFLFQERDINVEWLITVRLLSTGICFLLYAAIFEKVNIFSIWKERKDAIQLLVFSIAGMLAVQYTYFAAIKHSNAATATVLQYSGPVMIAIYLAWKNRKWPSSIELLAILLAITGTFLLVTHGDIHSLNISPLALFLGLSAAVTLAIYTLQPLRLLARHRSTLVIGWGMLVGGLVMSCFKAPWSVSGQWDSYSYLFISLIIVFGTLIPFYAYVNAVKLIGGQKASLLASAEPLSATVLAVYWLNTPFSTLDWIGSFCIIFTVGLLTLSKTK